MIDPHATVVTGLCNYHLEFEPTFDKNLINLLKMFIDSFTKPVCLIAHNGLRFDFPILRNHLEKFGVGFAENVLCADCLHAFYNIMESRKTKNTEVSTFVTTNDITMECDDNMEFYNKNTLDMKLRNERSPTRFIRSSPATPRKPNHVRMLPKSTLPWKNCEKPKETYKLKDIYERLLNRRAQNPHQAENDCILALECAVALSEEFVKWVDENNYLFSEITPMTIGIPIGNEVLKKWRGINDTFKKYVKKLKDEKRSGTGAKSIKEYHLYKQLLFLKKKLQNETTDSINETEMQAPPGQENQARSEKSPRRYQQKPRKRKANEFEDEIINIIKEPENRHMSFFKGILPSLDKLDENKTLIFQSRVLQTLTDLLQPAYQGYPPYSSSYHPSNYQSYTGYQTQHFANQTPLTRPHLSHEQSSNAVQTPISHLPHEQSSNAGEDQINSPSDNYSTYSVLSAEEEFDFT